MGRFTASLKTYGNRRGLPATVEVGDGRLRIATGGTDIGDWPLDDVRLEKTPAGYRLWADGEQLFIEEMTEADAFADEVAHPPRGGRRHRRVPGRAGARMAGLWSSLLPRWVSTRVMLGVVVASLALTVAAPGLVSVFLLLSGVLIVTLGATVYGDHILATKWLPGRTTPMHLLIFGVVVLMLGTLLAVVTSG